MAGDMKFHRHMNQALLDCLPLVIQKVSWTGDDLRLLGIDWSFTTTSAWRLVNDEALLFASMEHDADIRVMTLAQLSIIAVRPQCQSVPLDPVFELSDGTCLEIFSTDTFEPWVLSLPNEIYVGGT